MNGEIKKHSMRKGDLPHQIEKVARTIIGCAIEVLRTLGSGLLEKIYEEALVYELQVAGLGIEQQKEIQIHYKAIILRGQRLDLLVERSVLIEIKAVTTLQDVHAAQTLSYL